MKQALSRLRDALFIVAMSAGLTAGTALAGDISGLNPASPQPDASALAPGLAVEYLRIKANHVDEIEASGKGKPGEALTMLDWNTGDDLVLTSDYSTEVGARITGFIKFPEAGTYIMTIQSNDGVRMLIGEQKIIEDPGVHRDRYSDYVNVAITEAGWYPFYMIYFQKKGTATLELYWQKPGDENFEFVPEEAFAHLPG